MRTVTKEMTLPMYSDSQMSKIAGLVQGQMMSTMRNHFSKITCSKSAQIRYNISLAGQRTIKLILTELEPRMWDLLMKHKTMIDSRDLSF